MYDYEDCALRSRLWNLDQAMRSVLGPIGPGFTNLGCCGTPWLDIITSPVFWDDIILLLASERKAHLFPFFLLLFKVWKTVPLCLCLFNYFVEMVVSSVSGFRGRIVLLDSEEHRCLNIDPFLSQFNSVQFQQNCSICTSLHCDCLSTRVDLTLWYNSCLLSIIEIWEKS